MIVFLIILCSLLLIALFFIVGFYARLKIDEIARRNCENLVDCTVDFIKNNLGFIRVISGPIRSGKSTMTAGITHADQIIIQDAIMEKINYTRSIMHDVDWISIDSDIENQHQLTHDRFLTFRFISKKYAEMLDDKTYDNHLKRITYYQMLDDYIYAYFRMLDNNYVLSNIDVYSHIIGNYSLRFDSNFMKIKQLVIANEMKVMKTQYPILRYTTIFEDEKLLGDKTNINLSANRSDDGSPVFLRLLGQLGKETIYYNTTAQSAFRWVKNERELATSIIYIKNRDVIGNLPFKSWIYKRKIRRNDRKMYRYARKHFKEPKERELFFKSDSVFKQNYMKYKDALNAIFANAYLNYHCIIYRRIDDVGKSSSEVKDALNFDFVFPVSWCFGSIDSHFYSFLQDYLEGYGRSPYYDLEKETTSSISDFAKAKELLKKKETEEKTEKKEGKEKKDNGSKKGSNASDNGQNKSD